MAADPVRLQGLLESLHDATASLPNIIWKRMFGCDAVFCEGTIFGQVWKEGRIGLKFTEEGVFEKKNQHRRLISMDCSRRERSSRVGHRCI